MNRVSGRIHLGARSSAAFFDPERTKVGNSEPNSMQDHGTGMSQLSEATVGEWLEAEERKTRVINIYGYRVVPFVSRLGEAERPGAKRGCMKRKNQASAILSSQKLTNADGKTWRRLLRNPCTSAPRTLLLLFLDWEEDNSSRMY